MIYHAPLNVVIQLPYLCVDHQQRGAECSNALHAPVHHTYVELEGPPPPPLHGKIYLKFISILIIGLSPQCTTCICSSLTKIKARRYLISPCPRKVKELDPEKKRRKAAKLGKQDQTCERCNEPKGKREKQRNWEK